MGLDGRHSFLSGQPVKFWGGRYGLDFGKVALFTGLYNGSYAKSGEGDTFYTSFNYMSSTFEYYVHQSWRFEVVTSCQVGWGYGTLVQRNSHTHKSFAGNIIPVEFGIGGSMRVLRYFGFSAGVGLRLSMVQQTGFSGTYYYGGLTYYTGTMYRDFKKLTRKRNP